MSLLDEVREAPTLEMSAHAVSPYLADGISSVVLVSPEARDALLAVVDAAEYLMFTGRDEIAERLGWQALAGRLRQP